MCFGAYDGGLNAHKTHTSIQVRHDEKEGILASNVEMRLHCTHSDCVSGCKLSCVKPSINYELERQLTNMLLRMRPVSSVIVACMDVIMKEGEKVFRKPQSCITAGGKRRTKSCWCGLRIWAGKVVRKVDLET